MDTVKYSYLDDNRHEQAAAWQGERQDALDAAIRYLAARQSTDDAAEYIYRDDATGSEWASDEDDLIVLGAAILDCRDNDMYSLWCAGYPAREIS